MQHPRIKALRSLLCCALVWIIPSQAAPNIQLKILEGDGETYATGSRATRGITVLVTDQAGNPIENAAVSFKLPDQGPSGTFTATERTQTVTTGADGRATVWGMQWNKTPGTTEVLVTAVKNEARASIVVKQVLSDKVPAEAGGEGEFRSSHHSAKWIIIGAAVAGAAAAGMMAMHSHSSSSTASTPAISIGSPTITVSHP